MSRLQSTLTPLNVLIVEDSDDDLHLLLRELSGGGYDARYQRVHSRRGLHEALAAGHDWEIVLSDYSLPGMTGFDVVGTVLRTHPDLPCIVISGTITEEAAVAVLRAGARDFIVKERMARLVPAIRRELDEARERIRRRDAEESLRETRERMQFVLDVVGIGTWSRDLRTGAILWSEVMERLHGFSPGMFGGRDADCRAVVHPEDYERTAEWFEHLATGRDGRVEYRTTWPDGSVHWIQVIGRIAGDPAGGTPRAVGVAMEVTAQKELEQQVQQAQKMESIGSLAGGIAHDFNNLLTVITGFADLAADRTSDPAVTEPLKEIGNAAASATALTRQLLTFSRRQIVKPRLMALSDHITGFGPILRRMVEEDVQLDFRLAAGLPLVRADPGQIEQVLLNLVANARDAMPGGGTVTIETESVTVGPAQVAPAPRLREGAWVVLSVADTGAGMSPEVQRRLFDPFFTTKPPGKGTGLGLATVYGIVKASGGEIVLQSELGAGSLFRVYLPAATPDETTADRPGLEIGSNSTGGGTILVVEDNPALRRLAQRVLTRQGYAVLTAQDGTDARRVCDHHPGRIDAVLVDIVMPGDSGPTVAAAIARSRPGVGVVYMSGYTGDVAGVDPGADGSVFLPKPFTATQLVDAVRQVLQRPAGGRS